MIKTIITPNENILHLPIPNNYVGEELEVLLYRTDEISIEKNNNPNNAARFKGLLSKKEAEKYHNYLKQAREEWERDI